VLLLVCGSTTGSACLTIYRHFLVLLLCIFLRYPYIVTYRGGGTLQLPWRSLQTYSSPATPSVGPITARCWQISWHMRWSFHVAAPAVWNALPSHHPLVVDSLELVQNPSYHTGLRTPLNFCWRAYYLTFTFVLTARLKSLDQLQRKRRRARQQRTMGLRWMWLSHYFAAFFVCLWSLICL